MSLKKLCPTFILTLLLATSAFAGGMEVGEIATPTPPAATTTLCGEMECPTTQPTSDVTAATVAETALGLIGSVVALF
jgi:hypothetical protein